MVAPFLDWEAFKEDEALSIEYLNFDRVQKY